MRTAGALTALSIALMPSLASGCGEEEAPAHSPAPEAQTAPDQTGDVIEDAELGGPGDRQRLDLQRVSLHRSKGRLRATFETVEQPGEAQILRLVASNTEGTRTVVLEARFRGDAPPRAVYRPPSGEPGRASLRRRGASVSVEAPVDSLTSHDRFRWQARIVTLRGAPEVVDRLPAVGSKRLRFPR